MKILRNELKKHANPEKAKLLQGFFKTGKGEYGYGDVFIGVMVPKTRKVVNEHHKRVKINDIKPLLHSKIHEERLLALLILVKKYQKADEKQKRKIFDLYLANTKYVNNWDLVDLTAPNIVGAYLSNKNKSILYKLSKSHLWDKRIAIISTAYFIRNNEFKDTLKISEILLNDKHDLIHKAVGWMLREVGKRNIAEEERFLKKHYKKMPRTMLRYAIEKFPEQKRKKYLNGTI